MNPINTRNPWNPTESGVDNQSVEALARLLWFSRRPVLIAGRGIKQSGAETILEKILNLTRIPCFTSFPAEELSGVSDSLFIGSLADSKQGAGLKAISESDLIINVGSGINALSVFETFLDPNAIIYQIDSTPSRMVLQIPITRSVIGDINAFLKACFDKIEEIIPSNTISTVYQRFKRWAEMLRQENEVIIRNALG